MRYQPANLIGGFYADDARLWSQQDVVNWLPTVTEVEGTRTQVMLRTPPGLSFFTNVGAGPIRGARNVEGKLFVVSGTELYEVFVGGGQAYLGVIPGVGRVSMAHNKRGFGNQLLVVNDAAGYVWDTSAETLTKITDSGYPGAVMVDYLDHYLIQVEPFGRFWFHSNLDNASDYNTTDRYDAEASPDAIVGIAANQLEAVVFSRGTTEFFANTGASTNTFQSKRIVIERGCAGRHTIVKIDNTLAWLGNDGIFYRLNGYGAQPISPKPLSGALTGLDWANAFGFVWEDRAYKVAYWTFPDGQTWGYDPTQPPGYQWHRRESYGRDRWRLNTLTQWQGLNIGGDSTTGTLFLLDWDAADEAGEPMVSLRTGPTVSDNQNRVLCPHLALIFDTGTPDGSTDPAPTEGPDIEPMTEGAPVGVVGEAYNAPIGYQWVITAGSAPIAGVALVDGELPDGLTMDADSGDITGTPTEAGGFPVTARVTDTNGLYDEAEDTIPVYLPMFIAQDNVLTLDKSSDGGTSFQDSLATGLTTATSSVCVQSAGGKLFHLGVSDEGRVSTNAAASAFTACTGLLSLSGFVPGTGNMLKIGDEYQLYHWGLHVSTNGIAWTERVISSGAHDAVNRPVARVADVVSESIVLAVAAANVLNVSEDAGETFTEYTVAAFHATEGVQRLLDTGTYFYAFGRDATTGNLLIGRSATGLSGSWTTTAGPANAIVHGCARNPFSGRVTIVLQTGATWVCDNPDAAVPVWTAGAAVPYAGALTYPPLQANNMIFTENAGFYFAAAQAAGVNKVYLSFDGESEWAEVFGNASGNAINSLCEHNPYE